VLRLPEAPRGGREDYAHGGSLGDRDAGVFINNRFLSGAQPFEAFQAIIDDEIGS
jgi:hypothetical protein